MSTPRLYVDGKLVRLGKRIGRGGEGDVYALDDSAGHALKIYKRPDQEREAKIVAMTAAGLAARSSLIAFPMATVRDKGKRFAGFTMRLVSGHQPLFELYSPGARKISFPKADYRFTVRAAANIARAVGQVHEAGVVIGDINHSGILISDQAVAALIDADSFQFGTHLCRVGVPEYTPPELQGQRFDGVRRTTQHDAFGLAVVVFQLLFMGRHPFVGRYARGEMPIEKAISEFRFAYSGRNDVGMTPPPGTCRLSDFPTPIGAAFEAAFGREPSNRPTAVQWISMLQELEHSLRKCTANPLHYYPASAQSCTWCRMECTVGMILFVPAFSLGVTTPIVDPGAGGFNLVQVWAAIERIQVPNPVNLSPPLPSQQLAASDAAKEHKRSQLGRRAVGFVAIVVAVILLFGAGSFWFVYGPLAWFGVVRAFSNEAQSGPFAAKYTQAEQTFQRALDDWRKRTGATEIRDRRKALAEAKQKLADLPRLETQRLAEYESKRREAQLHRFLDSYPIRRARIRGIGPAREATLASYGIDTAADITRRAVLAVPSFGEASAEPLLEWRRRIESRFVYSVQPTAADQQATEQIRRNFAAEAAQLRQTLLRGANELNTGLAMVQARLKSADPAVNRAYEEREQAKTDLEFLGQPIPKVVAKVAPAPSPVRTTVQPARTTPSPPTRAGMTAVSCPTCGGRMVRRVARKGPRAGRPFWGCARFPSCRGTRPI